MYSEYETRRKADEELRTEISASRKQTRAIYEQMQEEANNLAAAELTSVYSIVQESIKTATRQKAYQTAVQEEIKTRNQRIYDWISSLQGQINELAYMKLSDLKTSYELDGRLSVIEGEIDAVMSEIDPDGTATDDEADEAIEDAFSTDTAIEVEPEFEELADEIFGVNP